jgi:hypothetical protein
MLSSDVFFNKLFQNIPTQSDDFSKSLHSLYESYGSQHFSLMKNKVMMRIYESFTEEDHNRMKDFLGKLKSDYCFSKNVYSKNE